MITLVLGGSRSGKSSLAERLVLAHEGPLAYLATGVATDDDMAARIEAHRARRDPRFITIVAGADLAAAVRLAPSVPMLVDALGTWVASQPEFAVDAPGTGRPTRGGPEPDPRTGSLEQVWTPRLDEVVAALGDRAESTVLVSDEVGLGVHPETAVGRRFRDALGLVNQCIAEVADDVLLVVAGRVLRLEREADVLAGPPPPTGAAEEPELDLRTLPPPPVAPPPPLLGRPADAGAAGEPSAGGGA